ncbi:MBOAT family protein [Phenylobacterium sp.]|uniref:MBOAT family O-acyltransferase n=1 Tax=Phenylobacterium sp. TaxID=1871053 RepID=UPI002733440C|nr:MBOAT family O-acyltransferase [Phenylobacterium sp.]MDP3632613.1 MBOAT family O-acyltransferase [Phenylobacterium sp.]
MADAPIAEFDRGPPSKTMLFASPTFLFVFLPLCLAAYFASPSIALKNAVLLAASLVFYAWGEPVFVVLMAAMTLANYAAALAIDAREGAARKGALALAVAINLGALTVFKYAGLIAVSLGLPDPQIPLPLGISFFTFHCLSYLIDTYRRRFPANRDVTQVALYIALFPQLIAGPIVRYKTIAKRLAHRRHSLGRASAGIRLFIIGLAQKLLIADPIAPLADAVFDHARAPGLIEAWLGAGAYALQIYFDFAAYSTMAIGLAVIFGFSLPRNFRTPYASASVTEFWRRWHISLSTWFRDYLYIPLGGNRGPAWKTWRNLIVVFLLCGLWHGAAWTFLLWGAWHGLFLVLERAGLGRLLARLPRPASWAYALTAVTLGWVLFRAADMGRVVDLWAGMAGLRGLGGLQAQTHAALQPLHLWLVPLAGLLAVFGLPRVLRKVRGLAWVDTAGVVLLLALCLLKVAWGAYSPFLYFRF